MFSQVRALLFSGNQPAHQRSQPGEQQPGNLRQEEKSERTEQATAQHQEERDRRYQQEHNQYDPASFPCRLAIQEEDKNESSYRTGEKEEDIICKWRFSIQTLEAQGVCNHLCDHR